jgi:hypothetical protein
MLRRSGLALMFLLLGLAFTFAQEKNDADGSGAQEVTLKATTHMVVLDVVVINSNGVMRRICSRTISRSRKMASRRRSSLSKFPARVVRLRRRRTEHHRRKLPAELREQSSCWTNSTPSGCLPLKPAGI